MARPEAVDRNNRHRRMRRRRSQVQVRSASVDTLSDERELIERFRDKGDTAARNEVIERFMPLARRLARRYQRPNVALDDLVQVAALGLVKAVDRFDPAHGTELSSFAVPTILGELKRYFRDHSWSLHVPRDMQERALRVNQTVETLAHRLGRTPTASQVAAEIGDSIENVLEAMEATAAFEPVSLESSGEEGEDDSESGSFQVGSEDERFDLVEEAASVAPQLKALPERERLVLGLRFVEDLTQAQIARRVGVSQMHVSRLIERALRRVRRAYEHQAGPAYSGAGG